MLAGRRRQGLSSGCRQAHEISKCKQSPDAAAELRKIASPPMGDASTWVEPGRTIVDETTGSRYNGMTACWFCNKNSGSDYRRHADARLYHRLACLGAGHEQASGAPPLGGSRPLGGCMMADLLSAYTAAGFVDDMTQISHTSIVLQRLKLHTH